MIELYEKAVDLGDVKAMLALGRIYEYGIGVKEDHELAWEYYDRAAKLNSPYGNYLIGYFWENVKL